MDLDDDKQLHAALGSNEPLTGVSEDGLVGLGGGDFEDDTRAVAGGDGGGRGTGAAVEVTEGGVGLFAEAGRVLSAAGDVARSRTSVPVKNMMERRSAGVVMCVDSMSSLK